MRVLTANDDRKVSLPNASPNFLLPITGHLFLHRPVLHVEWRVRMLCLPGQKGPEIFIVIEVEANKRALSNHCVFSERSPRERRTSKMLFQLRRPPPQGLL